MHLMRHGRNQSTKIQGYTAYQKLHLSSPSTRNCSSCVQIFHPNSPASQKLLKPSKSSTPNLKVLLCKYPKWCDDSQSNLIFFCSLPHIFQKKNRLRSCYVVLRNCICELHKSIKDVEHCRPA